MKIRAMGGIATIAVLALPAGASATSTTPRELVSAAVNATADACRPSDPDADLAITLSETPPSSAFTDHVALLRRPQVDGDLRSLDRLRLFGEVTVLRPGIRVAQGPDGRAYDVIPVTGRHFAVAPGCHRAQDRALKRLSAKARPKVAAAARRRMAEQRARMTEERLLVASDQAGGLWGGGGGPNAATLAGGFSGPGAYGGGPMGERSVLYAVVPDGVARVTWRFAGGLEATVPVADNIAAGEIASDPTRLQWISTRYLAADGTVIREGSRSVGR